MNTAPNKPLGFFTKKVKSPVGTLTLLANNKALLAVLFPNTKKMSGDVDKATQNNNHPILKKAEKQLKATSKNRIF